MTTATVTQLWRYPVKSMIGEQLDATAITEHGVAGDRGWAVRDEVRGGIRGARKLAGLMRLAARYVSEPDGTTVPPAIITAPDGRKMQSDAPEASAFVSDAIGHEVTLWPLRPASDADHYRRAPMEGDLLAELREIFGRDTDAELPDISGLPPELFEYETPPGAYYDAYPLLVVSEESLATLQARAPKAVVDVRRFRPNIVVRTGSTEPWPEQQWIGREVAIGDARIEVVTGCPRCVMITRPFAELPEDRSLVKTVVREADHVIGVYARAVRPGRVAVGSAVSERT